MSSREEAEMQISELDLLSSMFPYEEEFAVTDQLAVAELKHFVENESAEMPSSKIQFILNVKPEDSHASMVTIIKPLSASPAELRSKSIFDAEL